MMIKDKMEQIEDSGLPVEFCVVCTMNPASKVRYFLAYKHLHVNLMSLLSSYFFTVLINSCNMFFYMNQSINKYHMENLKNESHTEIII